MSETVRSVETFGNRALLSLMRSDGRIATLTKINKKLTYAIGSNVRWSGFLTYDFDPSALQVNDEIEFRYDSASNTYRILHPSTAVQEENFKRAEQLEFEQKQAEIESRIKNLDRLGSPDALQSIAEYRRTGDVGRLMSINPLDFDYVDLHKTKWRKVKVSASECWPDQESGRMCGWAIVQFQLQNGEYEKKPSAFIDVSEYPSLMKYVEANCYRIDEEFETRNTRRFGYRLPTGLEITFQNYGKSILIRDVELREAAFQMGR